MTLLSYIAFFVAVTFGFFNPYSPEWFRLALILAVILAIPLCEIAGRLGDILDATEELDEELEK